MLLGFLAALRIKLVNFSFSLLAEQVKKQVKQRIWVFRGLGVASWLLCHTCVYDIFFLAINYEEKACSFVFPS